MDGASGFYEEHARYRELMVFLTRHRFEVDPVFEVPANLVIAELERDSECASGRERTIGVEPVAEALRLPALLEFGGLVCADGDDRKTQCREFGFDLAQLAELRVAIGSPAAAIEDEQRTRFVEEFRKVDDRSVQGLDAHRRHGRARLQGLGGLWVRTGAVRRSRQARDQQQTGCPASARSRALAGGSGGVEVRIHSAHSSILQPLANMRFTGGL